LLSSCITPFGTRAPGAGGSGEADQPVGDHAYAPPPGEDPFDVGAAVERAANNRLTWRVVSERKLTDAAGCWE
jgi:hypothetical protein